MRYKGIVQNAIRFMLIVHGASPLSSPMKRCAKSIWNNITELLVKRECNEG